MHTPQIVSLKNERIKAASSLKTGKGRRESGLLLLEGHKLIAEALAAGLTLREIFYSEEEALALSGAGRELATSVSPKVLQRLCDAESPQGIVATAVQPELRLDALKRGGRYLLLENLQNAGNVGNILRSAEAFGVDGVLFCSAAVDLMSPKVLRGSMGSALRMPTAFYRDVGEAVRAIRKAGLPLWASVLREDAVLLTDFRGGSGVMAVGNEGAGLTQELIAESDALVFIPMKGKTESLSAPTAAAVLMWELWGRSPD